MPVLEIFFSFRSPYSYLAIDRLVDMDAQYNVGTQLRPVRPLALREPDFFSKGRPQFLPYLFKDAPREAKRLGISFGMPQPDPIVMDMATGVVDKDQPAITKVMALAIAAVESGNGLRFAQAVSRSTWGGAANWCDDTVLQDTLAGAGMSLEPLAKWAADNADEIEKIITENEAEQFKHHWGVPVMVLDGEPFFGQDRIDALRWRLDQLGLAKA